MASATAYPECRSLRLLLLLLLLLLLPALRFAIDFD